MDYVAIERPAARAVRRADARQRRARRARAAAARHACERGGRPRRDDDEDRPDSRRGPAALAARGRLRAGRSALQVGRGRRLRRRSGPEQEAARWNRSRRSAGRSATSTAPTSTPTRSCPSSSSSGSSAPASAQFLFYDWAKEPGWELPRQPDPRRRRELRLRLLARARAVGPAGLRLPGDRRAELRGHLLLQLHQDRAAAGRALRRGLPQRSRAPGDGQIDLRAAGGPLRRRAGAVRDRPRDPPPAARRARRHRADAAAGRADRRLRARARARGGRAAAVTTALCSGAW